MPASSPSSQPWQVWKRKLAHYTLPVYGKSGPYAMCRPTGTPRRGGFHKLCAYIAMRARGRRTPATATTAGCSSCSGLGTASAGGNVLTRRFHESSSTAHGWFTGVTETRGASGERLRRVDSGEAWERANREALGWTE